MNGNCIAKEEDLKKITRLPDLFYKIITVKENRWIVFDRPHQKCNGREIKSRIEKLKGFHINNFHN